LYCQRQDCTIIVVTKCAFLLLIEYIYIVGRSAANVYNQNTVGNNGYFQPLHAIKSRER